MEEVGNGALLSPDDGDLRELFDAVADGLVALDPDTGALLDANEEFCALVGRDRVDLVGSSLESIAVDEMGYAPAALLERVRDPDPDEDFEWVFRGADGDLPVELRLSPLSLDGGDCVLASVRDVSGRRERRRELEEYRRRMEGAMLAGDVAWWEMDVGTGAVEFDDRKARMLGYDPGGFEHYEDFTELIHPDDYERAMDSMRDHIEGRARKYGTEYRIETAGGEYRWFHDVGGITHREADGTPLKVTGIVLDVTDRKETEERLRRQNERLALLNRVVRHDIRNDMEVVAGWLDPLEERADDDLGEEICRIREASESVIELTRSVRDLMEVLDEEALDLRAVSLADAVEEQVRKIRSSHPEATVECDITDVGVQANSMLSSVFRNLLNNAVDHSHRADPTVEVSTDVGEEAVVVRVADDGPGIPDDRKEAVFGREEKCIESTGSGVGLYLVDTLVDAYGGEVWVTDNDPEGSVFHVELPLAA